MNTNNLLFAQLTKVDAEKRLVYGRAAQEYQDHADEIMDYDSSKPLFQKWSEVSKSATGGASVGNLRAMHGKVAAGKLTDFICNDEEKAFDICAKVVDDNEWKKVLEGVYTGFSIGGGYAKRWADTTNPAMTRYTADPAEISLVDRPCIPTATFFEVHKADGIMEKVAFKPAVVEETPDPLEVKGSDSEVLAFAKFVNDESMSMGDVLQILQKSKEAPVKPVAVEKKFADAVNKKYPLDNDAQIKAAWAFINKAAAKAKYSEEEFTKVSSTIAAAWKEMIDKDGPPEIEKMEQTPLKKGLYTIQSMANIVQSLQQLLDSVEYEEEQEGDDSDIPARLNDCVMNMGQILVDYTAEEVAELTANNKGGDDISSMPAMAMSQAANDLIKRAAEFKKAGARNSKADQDKIQAMHDHAVDLGATCSAKDPAKATTMEGLGKIKINMNDALQKAIAVAMEPLQKALTEANGKIAKLEAQPAPTKAILRVVGKGEDIAEGKELKKDDPVKNPDGTESEAGSLIKSLHKQGGTHVKF